MEDVTHGCYTSRFGPGNLGAETGMAHQHNIHYINRLSKIWNEEDGGMESVTWAVTLGVTHVTLFGDLKLENRDGKSKKRIYREDL